MRVCIEKATGKIIESQSGGTTQEHLDTLKQNALNAGYLETDIEVKYMDDAEFAVLLKQQIDSEKTYADKRKAEYPSIYEYIDGIVKGDTVQVQAYIDACKAVKNKYPKEVVK